MHHLQYRMLTYEYLDCAFVCTSNHITHRYAARNVNAQGDTSVGAARIDVSSPLCASLGAKEGDYLVIRRKDHSSAVRISMWCMHTYVSEAKQFRGAC